VKTKMDDKIISSKIIDLSIAYFDVKQFVISNGFANEIDWIEELDFEDLREQEFLRESAWVILSSGMSDKVVRKIFLAMTDVFYNWESSKRIILNKNTILTKALNIFKHRGKIEAIIEVAERVYTYGFQYIKEQIRNYGINYIESFKFIGPTTKYHLAKNIGLAVAKPDRHLIRLAKRNGFITPHAMCEAISSYTKEKVAVIDIVLWRFATLNRKYEIETMN